ncbi:metallophosphoesterase family protein [Devosia sp.]|uniref:metallophosphoesterase family protein n=1 Tax=Devosia sp. TaxID=1871048 RepID=UPI003A925399
MKLAVLSDVHGNLHALDAVLEDIAGQGVDQTVALGDFLSGPYDPAGVADRLMALDLQSVRGNHDRFIVNGRKDDWEIDVLARNALSAAQKDWLAGIPATGRVGDVFLCHGTPSSDMVLWLTGIDDDGKAFYRSQESITREAEGVEAEVLLCGHTHIARSLRLGDGRLVVNPGSVGMPLAIGSPAAHYAIIEKMTHGWRSSLIAVPYDNEAAAHQALDHGYPTWADSVRSGWSLPWAL